MNKDSLRKHISQLKRQLTRQALDELSLAVTERLERRLADAQTVLAYYSLPDEVCTHRLLDRLVAAGKTVLLPKVTSDTGMELHRYTGSCDLREGAFHIMEPVGEPVSDCHIDVALIPGVAFDRQGYRLGRGRGYYDRFLSAISEKHTEVAGIRIDVKIGICFPFQLVKEVPHDAHDVLMDEVDFS